MTKGKEDSNTNHTESAAADREEETKEPSVPILSEESVINPVDTSNTNISSSGVLPIVVPSVIPTVPTGTVTDDKDQVSASGDTGSGTTKPIIPKTLSSNQSGSGDQRIPNPTADTNATGKEESDTGTKSGSSGGNPVLVMLIPKLVEIVTLLSSTFPSINSDKLPVEHRLVHLERKVPSHWI